MYAEFCFALINSSDPIDPTCSVLHVKKEYLTTCNALEMVSIVEYKDVHIQWIFYDDLTLTLI
jgi:hypothetical protein